jgi:hypothetical protein
VFLASEHGFLSFLVMGNDFDKAGSRASEFGSELRALFI